MRLYVPPPLPPYSEQKCTLELDHILKTSTKVAVLLNAIQTLSKNALSRGITCRPCIGTTQESKMGYYDGTYKRVVICCDHIRTREELEDTLVHELIHAFDSVRKGNFKSVCHLIACGEVRASALGQCANIKSEKKRKECIWKDAVNSTKLHCGSERAEKTVKEVFYNCTRDETPFK
ncbi:peptidase M76 [Cokeromyces recurvatus]|uniref:peptidase M76 n=1 Tax=Cokeromyces recurvatus TaxID=90255 RepID=UPI00221E762C|nr:peptidase M76 [Cokeromyces recurvatus]KAI7904505.1 peptidase M76 [Cokeromyces recurvatus]